MLGEFGKLLRAIANGPDPNSIPAPTEVIPTLLVAKYDASWSYSRDLYLFQGHHQQAAGASYAHVGLHNPTGSGCVITIEEIHAMSSMRTIGLWLASSAQVAGFDNDGSEMVRDSRLRLGTAVTKNPVGIIISDDATQKGTVANYLIPVATDETNDDFFYHQNTPLVLFPGACWILTTNSTGEELIASFVWSERRYDPQEIAGVRNQHFV